jgi:hypothetical protein
MSSSTLPLSSTSLSRSSRLALARAGFASVGDVLSLAHAPAQLAADLALPPQQALAIIRQLQQQLAQGEEKTDASAEGGVGAATGAAGELKENRVASGSPAPPASSSVGKPTDYAARMTHAAKNDGPSCESRVQNASKLGEQHRLD